MRLTAHEDLLAAGADVDPDRDLVAHRSRGQKHRGLLAEERGDPLLQLRGRRILTLLLVPDLRGGDRRAHPSLGRVWVSE